MLPALILACLFRVAAASTPDSTADTDAQSFHHIPAINFEVPAAAPEHAIERCTHYDARTNALVVLHIDLGVLLKGQCLEAVVRDVHSPLNVFRRVPQCVGKLEVVFTPRYESVALASYSLSEFEVCFVNYVVDTNAAAAPRYVKLLLDIDLLYHGQALRQRLMLALVGLAKYREPLARLEREADQLGWQMKWLLERELRLRDMNEATFSHWTVYGALCMVLLVVMGSLQGAWTYRWLNRQVM